MAEELNDIVLVIHGGTARARTSVSADKEAAMREGLHQALRAGYSELQREGATSVDAVEAAIRVMEDLPQFNAGRGAVFTADERIELDASVMEGTTLQAGAVAAVTSVKNPITASRAVMEKSPHVLLVGEGAEHFCREQKLELVEPAYFRTPERLDELREAQHDELLPPKSGSLEVLRDREFGTVGAVAVDRSGHLAAGTSTGGRTNKRHGRVGDSPIIGAGTYADDRSCAVSCTGHGEYFIRLSVAHSIASLVRYKQYGVAQAAQEVVGRDLEAAGGVGGVIVLDARGRAAFAWNAPGLWRGWATKDGKFFVAAFDD